MSKAVKLILAILIFQLTWVCVFSRHLIGGEITYTCEGAGSVPNTMNWVVTMKIYRDCFGGGAQFDPQGEFGIYRRDSLTGQLSFFSSLSECFKRGD